jgi:hypothetical protein
VGQLLVLGLEQVHKPFGQLGFALFNLEFFLITTIFQK